MLKPICQLCFVFLLAFASLGAAAPGAPDEGTHSSHTPNGAYTPHVSFEQLADAACENPEHAAVPFSPAQTQALALWSALFTLVLILGIWAWRVQTPAMSWGSAAKTFFPLFAALALYAAFVLPPELRMGLNFSRAFSSAIKANSAQSAADVLWLAHWRALLSVLSWRAETIWRAHALLGIPALLLCLAWFRRQLPTLHSAIVALALFAFSLPLLFGLGSDLPLALALALFAASLLALEALFVETLFAQALALCTLFLCAVLAPFLPLLLWPRAVAGYFETTGKRFFPKALLLAAVWTTALYLENALIGTTWPFWQLPDFGRWLPLAAPLLTLSFVALFFNRRDARLWAWLVSALLAACCLPQAPSFFTNTLLPDTLFVLLLSPLAILGAQALAKHLTLRSAITVPLALVLLLLPSASFLAQRQDSLALRLYRFESSWLNEHHSAQSRLYRTNDPRLSAFPDFLVPRGQRPCLRPLSTLSKDPAPKGPRFLFVSPECFAAQNSNQNDSANCLPWQRLFKTSDVSCLAPLSTNANAENTCFVGLLGPQD